MSKKLILMVALWLAFGAYAFAQAIQGGPTILTHADFTCPKATASATPGAAIAASTPSAGSNIPSRLCLYLVNVAGTNAIRFGDANISTTQGDYLPATAGASAMICTMSAIYCYGIGGTEGLSITETIR